MTHAARPARGRRADRASPSRAPVPRARGRARRLQLGRRRPPRDRSGDERSSARSCGGKSAGRGRRRGHEARAHAAKDAQHRVDVLVGEDRGHDRVVVAVELFDEVRRTVGIVRTVPDLAVAMLEPARERDDSAIAAIGWPTNASAASRAPPIRISRPGTRCTNAWSGRTTTASTGATASFSVAIASSVSPRTSVCSSPTFVRSTTLVRSTLVASYRPPSPASTTATSTPASANAASAAAVTASNCVAPSRSAGERTRATVSSKSVSEPFSRMRSRQLATCGEMVEPTASPSDSRSCSIVTVAVDLPFVPTT